MLSLEDQCTLNTPRRQAPLMIPKAFAAGKGDLLPVVGGGL